MTYLGDFTLDDTFDIKFTTANPSTGAPTALVGGAISIYEDNSVTEITAGITLTSPFDGRTGMNHVRVVATGANGFQAGSNYQVVITTGTVGGTSAVGYVVAQFSIENRSSLRPTVKNRELNVAADGDIAGNVDGNVVGSVASVTAAVTLPTIPANWITAAGINANALDGKGDWNIGKTGYSLTQAFPANFADLAITVTTGLVSVGTLPTIPANWITAAGIAANALDNKGNWNVGKTGYSLTQAFPANFADLAITVTTGQVTIGTNNDKTGYSLSQAFPSNFADLAITATTGLVSVGTLPTIPTNWISAAGIAAGALNGKGDWNIGKTGYSLTQAFPSNFADLSIAITTGRVDIGAIQGLTDSATRLSRSTKAIVLVTVGTGSTTTAVVASSIDPASTSADQFKGKVLSFSENTTTAALRGQTTPIQSFNHTTQTFNVTALTAAPVSGDEGEVT